MKLPKSKPIFIVFIVVSIAALGFFIFKIIYNNKVYPGVTVAGIKIGGLSKNQSQNLLDKKIREFEQKKFVVNYQSRLINGLATDWGFQPDIKSSIENAFQLGHKSNPFSDLIEVIKSINDKGNLRLAYALDENKLNDFLKNNFGDLEIKAQNSALEYKNGDFVLRESKKGIVIDRALLKNRLGNNFGFLKTSSIELSLIEDLPEVTDDEIDTAYNQAHWIIDDGVTLNYTPVSKKEKLWKAPDNQLIGWIKFISADEERSLNNKILAAAIDKEKVKKYLETLAPEINQVPINARLTIGEDGRVKVFALSQEGRELKLDESADMIAEKLIAGQKQISLAVSVRQPEVTTENIDNLGINTLLAKGESNFKGSPKNRRHNIKVGAEKFNGVLVKPNEEFSFNTILGEVGAEQGYLPELVIKNNKTVPEYGGGLCQVSTTVFRAALNAGLSITERKNHAYVVRYYGTPGMDATIYPPHPDLKFKNDTPGSILVQSKIKGDDITFEFYGSSDGREVKLIGSNLYDQQSNGAVKAILYREIYKNNELVKKDTFRSNYSSPANYPKAPFE